MHTYVFSKLARVCGKGIVLAVLTVGHAGWVFADANYTLPASVKQIYPNDSWLPDPYQADYKDLTVEQIIELFTADSLKRDGIQSTGILVNYDQQTDVYNVFIASSDARVSDYETMHPAFIKNNEQALAGVEKCQNTQNCWNQGNPPPTEPWAFFPQFGLPMAMQKSVLMLNYPPVTALTNKDYLNTFTMNRWTRLLNIVMGQSSTDSVLYETIVDIRPIAAPGSGASDYLPDAQEYFNSQGNYYITPQLETMLDPPSNKSSSRTLPLVILGTPARTEWGKITGGSTKVLHTDIATGFGSKEVPFILGNHPDVTTYQCCPNDPSASCVGSNDLIYDEQIDVQIACWTKSMSEQPDQDPGDALHQCYEDWVGNPSAENQLSFCIAARMDSNECFDSGITIAEATSYCKSNNNDPCAQYQCPTGK